MIRDIARLRALTQKAAKEYGATAVGIECQLLSQGNLDLRGAELLAAEALCLESPAYARQTMVLRQLRTMLNRASWPFEKEYAPQTQQIRDVRIQVGRYVPDDFPDLNPFGNPTVEDITDAALQILRSRYGNCQMLVRLQSEPHPFSRIGLEQLRACSDALTAIRRRQRSIGINKGMGSRAPTQGLNRAAKEIASKIAEYLVECATARDREKRWGTRKRALTAAVRIVKTAFPISSRGLTVARIHGTLER